MTSHIDPFDELAAMFLTAPQPQLPAAASPAAASHEHSQAPRASAASRAMRELLIVGHLPVRGGLWLAPYADVLARTMGTVALVRLDGPEATLQLLRAPESMATQPLSMPLARTIRELAACVDVWIVRGAESMPADEAVTAAADRITLLSSADEAAVVAAYQRVKDLSQAAERSAIALPPVGLAVVGADHHAAAAVIDRLNRTTISFLGVEVKLVALLPRIDAGIKCTRYVTFSQQPPPSVAQVRLWIEEAETMTPTPSGFAAPFAAAPPQPEIAGRIEASPEAFVVDARRILRQPPAYADDAPPAPHARPAAASAPSAHKLGVPPAPPLDLPRVHASPAAGAAPAQRESDDLAAFIAPPAVKLPPKVVLELEHKPPAAHNAVVQPDEQGQPVPLARFVPGLVSLPLRAPGHERIELAVDGAGAIHLLARDHCLRELPVAQRWAMAHREIIAMACSQHRFDTGARCTCHIFASEPLAVADLHGSDLRLHVLAPVRIDDKVAWYAAPLNAV